MKVRARRFVLCGACCANPVHSLAARAFLGDDRLSRVALAQPAQLGVADFSANLILGIATTKGLVSLAMVLGSLFPIVTSLLAFIFLKERLHRVQYAGIASAVFGVAMIGAFSKQL